MEMHNGHRMTPGMADNMTAGTLSPSASMAMSPVNSSASTQDHSGEQAWRSVVSLYQMQ